MRSVNVSNTIFDRIDRGEIRAYTEWQDPQYLAFLTPFPNTPGVTVVIPKSNPGDYIFSLSSAEYQGLMNAARKVAKLLEKAFNTPRIALAFEGTGVAYVHAKLFPLHGELASKTGVWSEQTEFHSEYLGYFSTIEGPRMNDKELERLQKLITGSK
jgi:histidine triad (HIT) family protein